MYFYLSSGYSKFFSPLEENPMMTLSEYIHLHGRNVTARRMRMSPAAITYMIRDKRDIFVVEDAGLVQVVEFKVLAEFATPGQTRSDSPNPERCQTSSPVPSVSCSE
jgi:hypothetical protein